MVILELTYLLIISLVAYIFGAITKLFIEKIPNKFIPIQNVIIGVISAFICYFMKIETNLLNSIIMCLLATMSAGGVADLINIRKKTP